MALNRGAEDQVNAGGVDAEQARQIDAQPDAAMGAINLRHIYLRLLRFLNIISL